MSHPLRTTTPSETTGMKVVLLGLLSCAISALIILGNPLPVWAHAYSTETVVIKASPEKLMGEAEIAFTALGFTDDNDSGALEENEFYQQLSRVNGDLLESLHQNTRIECNGEVLPITTAWINPPDFSSQQGVSATSTVAVAFLTTPPGESVRSAQIRWAFPSLDTQLIFQSGETTLVSGLNDESVAVFEFGFWASVNTFLLQGIDHIAYGADHLLFLVVLALGLFKVAVNKRNWLRAVKLIAAFTLGHALSFTLAYFQVLSVPSGIVEPVIALSITVTAFAALTRVEWEKYWIIATAVGLVHGLGFASSLAQLGLATSEHAAAIISFNLGVDFAQVIVVSVVGLCLVLLRKTLPQWSSKITTVVLIAIGILGLIWTILRITESVVPIVEFLT
ncbi:HupE/UreJ family protein [uncultured Aurantimicrobium sp.]|uniref:HupE/UreJ family protein n=1 Tax=uncultured Aurantimicrobium sp. TaxID=1705357 RepID=UPI0026244EC5|nr:HupE/UreJ family protein [uncultured Aurantimicrobium sp.]